MLIVSYFEFGHIFYQLCFINSSHGGPAVGIYTKTIQMDEEIILKAYNMLVQK